MGLERRRRQCRLKVASCNFYELQGKPPELLLLNKSILCRKQHKTTFEHSLFVAVLLLGFVELQMKRLMRTVVTRCNLLSLEDRDSFRMN